MRLIAGKFKGIQLVAPEGLDTRPTSDRARESLFNILEHGRYSRLLRGATAVDIFAGTGALGLEALSRGAKNVIFFERDVKALSALSTNITKCKADDFCKIYKTDALNPPKAITPCDILFFDPPYHQDFATRSVSAFNAQNWIEKDGLCIIQTHPTDPFEAPEGFAIIDERKYGAARFLFMARQE